MNDPDFSASMKLINHYKNVRMNNNNNNNNCIMALCLGEPVPEETFHPLTPIVINNHPLSASSIYYDPQHPPCSIYMPDSLFAQPFSKFSLVYLLVWNAPLHTP